MLLPRDEFEMKISSLRPSYGLRLLLCRSHTQSPRTLEVFFDVVLCPVVLSYTFRRRSYADIGGKATPILHSNWSQFLLANSSLIFRFDA